MRERMYMRMHTPAIFFILRCTCTDTRWLQTCCGHFLAVSYVSCTKIQSQKKTS